MSSTLYNLFCISLFVIILSFIYYLDCAEHSWNKLKANKKSIIYILLAPFLLILWFIAMGLGNGLFDAEPQVNIFFLFIALCLGLSLEVCVEKSFNKTISNHQFFFWFFITVQPTLLRYFVEFIFLFMFGQPA